MNKQSAVLHNTIVSWPLLPVGTSEASRTPPQTFQTLISLLNTPDKRQRHPNMCFVPFSRERYIQKVFIVCAFDRTIEELIKDIGEELAKEVLTIRDNNPDVWTTSLENENFKSHAQDKTSDVGEEFFILYCEKIFIELCADINIYDFINDVTDNFLS
ncbi:22117_t:CDS:2 [Cetraspora pellucida]|uniref:22117_t:CDS:1 n=1 Tax=Cetraspora pellucida TaxID=1433469 RepID=A0A9N9I6W5_9GLOM|nr:22117_t:CDS:2 [Cetraspora pellucida]